MAEGVSSLKARFEQLAAPSGPSANAKSNSNNPQIAENASIPMSRNSTQSSHASAPEDTPPRKSIPPQIPLSTRPMFLETRRSSTPAATIARKPPPPIPTSRSACTSPDRPQPARSQSLNSPPLADPFADDTHKPIIPPRPLSTSGRIIPPPLPSRDAIPLAETPRSSSPALAPPPKRLVPPTIPTRPPAPSPTPKQLPLPAASGVKPPIRRLAPPAHPLTGSITPTTPTPATATPIPEPKLTSLPPPPTRLVPPDRPVSAPIRPISTAPDASEDEEAITDEESKRKDELPDTTYANRRPPTLSPPISINFKHHVHCFAMMKGILCTGGTNHVRVWNTITGQPMHTVTMHESAKVISIAFKHSSVETDVGRFVWCGTKDGVLCEIDAFSGSVVISRANIHPGSAVHAIFTTKTGDMLTLDDSGKVHIWSSTPTESPSLTQQPKTIRIAPKQSFVTFINDKIITSSGSSTKSSAGPGSIRVYDPSSPAATAPRPFWIPENLTSDLVGAVTAATTLSSSPNITYLSHESGHVSAWDSSTFTCISITRIALVAVTAIQGVSNYLWAGFRSGSINVYDLTDTKWKVLKSWKAHKEPVTAIHVDPTALLLVDYPTLHVASFGLDMCLQVWDGFMRDAWIEDEMSKRETTFCTYRNINILIVSWNVGAAKPTDLHGKVENMEFLSNIMATQNPPPDIIVFGYQEIIDINNKALTAKTMLLGKKKENSQFSDHVSSQYRLWHDKLVSGVRLAMPADNPYVVVGTDNLVGLFSCVFMRAAEQDALKDIATMTVKTGLGGRYGNKGAIVLRLIVDDSSLCFINCHLAAGQRHKRQRHADLIDILEEKSQFNASISDKLGVYLSGGTGQMVLDHEICFLSGDLNYRIDLSRPTVIHHVGINDLGPLLDQDQLNKEVSKNPSFRLKTFHEHRITFAPTYKYNVRSDIYDTSEKARCPAWCDRILWRTSGSATVSCSEYRRHEVDVSDHRPISGTFSVKIKSIVQSVRAQVYEQVEAEWREQHTKLWQAAVQFYGL